MGFTRSPDYVRANILNYPTLAQVSHDVLVYYMRKRKFPEMTMLEAELLKLPNVRV
jgi:hypothetical protein